MSLGQGGASISPPTSSLGAVQPGLLLNTTNATTVVQVVAPSDGLYQVRCTVDVVTAATVLTLEIQYTDPTTGAQTYQFYNASNVNVGSQIQLAGMIRASAGTDITVTATAGTTNQVTVGSVIDRAV